MMLSEYLRRVDLAVIKRHWEEATMSECYEVTIESRARIRCGCGGYFLNPVNFGDRPIWDFTPGTSPLPGAIIRCERCAAAMRLPALRGINAADDGEREGDESCTR